jgi:hypothetical protein
MVYLKLTSLPNIETFLGGSITCLIIDIVYFKLTSFPNIETHGWSNCGMVHSFRLGLGDLFVSLGPR